MERVAYQNDDILAEVQNRIFSNILQYHADHFLKFNYVPFGEDGIIAHFKISFFEREWYDPFPFDIIIVDI